MARGLGCVAKLSTRSPPSPDFQNQGRLVNPIDSTYTDLERLTSQFYDDLRMLGEFSQVASEHVPELYRGLLDHHSHMTVALEAFHESPIDLQVLDVHDEPKTYARQLALSRRRDHRIVLFGLMRLNPKLLPAEVMSDIRAQTTPLGHILIQHNVLREVQRLHLWHVQPGEELRGLFGLPDDRPIFGRTALIHCNAQPAIELLEIVVVD